MLKKIALSLTLLSLLNVTAFADEITSEDLARREADLAQREAALLQQENDFAPKAALLAKKTLENNAASAVLTGRETQIAKRETDLMERERALSW